MMRGPWGDVLEQLDVEPEEDDPLLEESRRRFEEAHERILPGELRERLLSGAHTHQGAGLSGAAQPAQTKTRSAAQDRARKQKNKRKMEAVSRKVNRKRRK